MCAIPLDKSNRTKQARHYDDYQHSEKSTTRTTDKERPDSEPTSLLKLVHYILNNCDDHQLERFAFAFVLHSSFDVYYSFKMHSRTKLEKALEGVPNNSDIVTMIGLEGATYRGIVEAGPLLSRRFSAYIALPKVFSKKSTTLHFLLLNQAKNA